jgi:hypothetical protein
MKAFVWNRLFETGIASVDAEHRALVEIVNRLGVLMIEGKATSAIDERDLRRTGRLRDSTLCQRRRLDGQGRCG